MRDSFFQAPRTKIVCTIGPASGSLEVIRKLVRAGMSVARLNFSHGSHADHAAHIATLRAVADEVGVPVTLMQDLQGPKIRVVNIGPDGLALERGGTVSLGAEGSGADVEVDYPGLDGEAAAGTRILLDDGLLELRVVEVNPLVCEVVDGGLLKNRKGVNVPDLQLTLPSMTDRDRENVEFGIAQGVDWISLSFVRSARDVRALRDFLNARGARIPIIAKVEKPHAIEHLEEIVEASDGLMVARGDLGVEMPPEKVPMLQKRIIRLCNSRGKPVITATQMLESMIRDPRPTRAEANDVANAILDGTDAVMLSGETAMGMHPVEAVEMMARIARETEEHSKFESHPPLQEDETHAMSEAILSFDRLLRPAVIALYTTTGESALAVSSQRPRARILALTRDRDVFHRLNLIWGLRPLLIGDNPGDFDELTATVDRELIARGAAVPGERILLVGGLPIGGTAAANVIKIHRVNSSAS
ncbi:MAG: pyruvate kinase [Verrucomicrobiae bacterium]